MKFRSKVVGCLLICAGSSAAEPIAPWASSPTLPEKYVKVAQQMQQQYCVPEKRDLNIPIYPGVELLSIALAARRPACPVPSFGHSPAAILLASADGYEDVSDWYRQSLTDYAVFERDASVIFVNGRPETFDWNWDLLTHPYVLVKRAGSHWQQGGYHSTIEMAWPSNQSLVPTR